LKKKVNNFIPSTFPKKFLPMMRRAFWVKDHHFAPHRRTLTDLYLPKTGRISIAAYEVLFYLNKLDRKRVHQSMRARNYCRSLRVSPHGEPRYLNHCPWRTFYNWWKQTYLIRQILKKALDNLNKGERPALRDLQRLDSQSIKIQGKGSKFVILETEEYDSKMYKQLNNPLHYRKLDSDSSSNHFDVVATWWNKWLSKGEITQHLAGSIANENVQPGKAFGTVKTHKEGNPLRLITSCRGTAIENLSAFTDFYLKPLSQALSSFIKDTTHLLQKISELDDTGPFRDGTLLVSWDVVAMFPNIDNDLGLLAVTQALNSRPNQFPSTECIVEAVKICVAHNNSSFGKEHYLQIHGTGMGPKNACSTRILRWVLSMNERNPVKLNLIYGGVTGTIFSISEHRVLPNFSNLLISSIRYTPQLNLRWFTRKYH
jgi:hypothetical protein